MRILCVSNLYPPHYQGGYELGMHELVSRLGRRGHEMHVLTSTHGVDSPRSDGDVHRRLRYQHLPPTAGAVARLLGYARRERFNRRALLDTLDTIRPHVVLFGSLTGVSVLLGSYVIEQRDVPACWLVSDYWPAEGDSWSRLVGLAGGDRRRGLAATIIRTLARCAGASPRRFSLANVIAVSDFVRDTLAQWHVDIGQCQVAHWGIDPEAFPAVAPRPRPGRILFAGRPAREKGLHLLLEAMRQLLASNRLGDWTLSIAGDPPAGVYAAQIAPILEPLQAAGRARFLGRIERSAMLQVYAEHDVLALPSTWQEPFSIALLEAMSSGLAVLATGTGGTPEAIRDGIEGLLLEPAAPAWAAALQRLAGEQGLSVRLGQNARRRVVERFTIERMTDLLESTLTTIAGGVNAPRPG